MHPGEGGRFHGHPWLVLLTVVVGMALELLDMTVVNVAIPHLMAEFGTDIDTIQWVATAYVIATGVVIPLSACLADNYGLSRVFAATVITFTAGSFLCGVAWNFHSLVAFRVIQGLAGGMIMPLGLSIVYQTFAGPARNTAMGIMGLPLLVAPAAGPVLGGYLVEKATWRLIFYINVPVGLLALAMAILVIPAMSGRPRKIDYPGFVLIASALGALLWALSKGPKDGWSAVHIVYLLVAASFGLVLFVLWELEEQEPLVDLGLLRSGLYSAGMGVVALAIMAVMGSLFLVPIYLQTVRGYGPLEAGLVTVPEALAAAVGLPLASMLINRVGPIVPALGGTALMAHGCWQLTKVGLDTPVPWLIEWLVVLGFGTGLGVMPVITLALDAVPLAQNNQATGLMNMVRQVASSFGVAVLATVTERHQHTHYLRLAEELTVARPGLPELMLRVRDLSYHRYEPAQLTALIADRIRLTALADSLGDALAVATLFALLAALGVVVLLFLQRAFAGKRQEGRQDEASTTQRIAHL